MDNKNKKFLDYIKNPMSKESISVIYDANNIKFEKCELYGDFVQSLLILVFDTYMGDDSTNPEQQIKHFNWCWEKNVLNFKEEGIFFDSDDLKVYFLEYLLEIFYVSEKNEFDYTDNESLRLWNTIFDYTKLKTKSEMDTFIEIYKIFEKSLKSS
jgi:hypothetical protein